MKRWIQSIYHTRSGWEISNYVAQGHLISVYKLQRMARDKKYRSWVFPAVPSGRARGCGHKMKYEKFHLSIRKYTENWHRLHQETVESISLEIPKNLIAYVLEQAPPADTAFSRRWDWGTDLQTCLPTSALLQCCDSLTGCQNYDFKC